MRIPDKRKMVMTRSMALGHCVCNPKQPCPCPVLIERDLCPCAGERPDPPQEVVRLTQHVRKAGCASKINRTDLSRVLAELPIPDDPNVLVGMAAGDDAGIYRLDGEWDLVQTVDVFSPIVDDPYTFGQISAANSVSDIYAMGGRPICALSIIGFPIEELPHDVMVAILRGGVDTLQVAGVSVIGGHSINDEEIKCGFAVSGLIGHGGGVANDGARVGDQLVLTKPIGTGLISFAAQIGRATAGVAECIGRSMATLNRDAAKWMVECGATACTDVTGFGLLGHLSEIARHSGVTAVVNGETVPVFADAVRCLRAGIIPGAVERNRESFAQNVTVSGDDIHLLDLLYDAQTSGGLLVALAESEIDTYVRAMHERGHEATSRIGEIVAREEHPVRVLLKEPTNLVGESGEPPPTSMKSADVVESCCDAPSESPACCEAVAAQGSQAQPPQLKKVAERTGDVLESSERAFKTFMQSVNAPGSVDGKFKRLLAIALSVSQRCEPCLELHIQKALEQGITWEEIDEAVWLTVGFCGAPAKMFYERIRQALERS